MENRKSVKYSKEANHLVTKLYSKLIIPLGDTLSGKPKEAVTKFKTEVKTLLAEKINALARAEKKARRRLIFLSALTGIAGATFFVDKILESTGSDLVEFHNPISISDTDNNEKVYDPEVAFIWSGDTQVPVNVQLTLPLEPFFDQNPETTEVYFHPLDENYEFTSDSSVRYLPTMDDAKFTVVGSKTTSLGEEFYLVQLPGSDKVYAVYTLLVERMVESMPELGNQDLMDENLDQTANEIEPTETPSSTAINTPTVPQAMVIPTEEAATVESTARSERTPTQEATGEPSSGVELVQSTNNGFGELVITSDSTKTFYTGEIVPIEGGSLFVADIDSDEVIQESVANGTQARIIKGYQFESGQPQGWVEVELEDGTRGRISIGFIEASNTLSSYIADFNDSWNPELDITDQDSNIVTAANGETYIIGATYTFEGEVTLYKSSDDTITNAYSFELPEGAVAVLNGISPDGKNAQLTIIDGNIRSGQETIGWVILN